MTSLALVNHSLEVSVCVESAAALFAGFAQPAPL
jgi:hypothetical protein